MRNMTHERRKSTIHTSFIGRDRKKYVTINIAVKCPEGIVLGSDSLTTITDDSDSIVSAIPYVSKLFSLGDSPIRDKAFPVGVMINGLNSIGGIRVEDIIEEFQEIYSNKHTSDEFSVANMAQDLGKYVQNYIDTTLGKSRKVVLELILAGFSKTKKSNRKKQRNGYKYGEIYSLFWEDSRTSRFRLVSNIDGEFLTYYGGQPTALDRFRYGIDEWIIYRMLDRKDYLYEDVRDYIYEELRKKSIDVPEILKVKVPNNMSKFNIFQLFSSGEQGKTIGETIRNIKENMDDRFRTMEGWFSLQTAVNYCIFLLGCAYAHNAFTFVLPVVGSEMRVASITRSEGFKFRRIWQIEAPGPPFSLK
jgi:hypothetical protein